MTTKYSRDYEAKDPFPYEIVGDVFKSEFNPTGFVPYPCDHGMKALPPGSEAIHRYPRTDPTGGLLPPYAGRSWGRSKYLRITAFGAKNGNIPFAIAACPVCVGEPRPKDMTSERDG